MAEIELPNPEELEEKKSKQFTRRVALTTAIYAVTLAISSLGGNNATKEMLLAQQQASDLWAHYQAKSIREHQVRVQKLRLEADLFERGAAMKPAGRKKLEGLLNEYVDQERHYNQDKKGIEKEAKALEHERDIYRTKDPYFDYGEALLQIAIVMASIAILSSSRPVFGFSLIVAVLGAIFTLNGFLLFFKLPILHITH
jgi:uncharacterized protein DUF4337